jgi:hypothetical protein
MRSSNMVFLAVLGLAFTGCAKDSDGDGFSGGDDCDDNNAAVNPKADEACDGLDNNCDGRVDEGLILEWYADLDGDKYGDTDTTVSACTQPAGYVDNADDCNDASSDFHPNSNLENCTEDVDYNCDGSTLFDDEDGDMVAACEDCDDANADVYAKSTWYIDYDLDGYGSALISQEACTQPDHYTDNTEDCDDLNPNVHPDGIEVCNEIDDNCDDSIDEGVASTFYSDADGDGYGTALVTAEACTVPEGFALSDDDCDDTLEAVNPGAEEVCDDGLDNDCDGEGGQCVIDPESADVVLWGTAAGDNAGIAVSGGGDLNGDGFDDIVVGAKNESTAASTAGAAYVIYGGDLPEEMTLDMADVVLTGESAADKGGRMVRIVHDVNDDDDADLLVAAPSADPSGDASGKVYINFGGGISGSLSDADVIFSGDYGYNYAGLGLAGGDFNEDGDGDVLIGAPGNDLGGSNRGTVYVIYGPIVSGAMDAGDVSDAITGQANSDEIGGVIASADLNGDGADDVLIGAPDNSEGGTDAGSVYVVYGPVTGVMSLDDADLQYVGESAADRFGVSVSNAGDIDGDAIDDFIAGATYDDEAGLDAGAAYVVAGDATSSGPVDEYAMAKIIGSGSEDQFGAQAVGGGDIDNDGQDDLMVSAPYSGGTADTGSVYVFYGTLAGTVISDDADARFDGDTLDDQFGTSLAFVGDVDGGPSNSSILIGAHRKDTTGADAGGAYLMNDIGL